MGVPNDDVVLIQRGKKPGEASVITVNCPDKTGLGCDLCRIILEFGLCITKGDVSTDGRWCYVVLWVIPHPGLNNVRWGSLKERLLAVCPSCLFQFYFPPQTSSRPSSLVYLLKFCCRDRKGLLHDVTEALWEKELMIQKVKVMTTPDDKVMDLFFITDNLDLLHKKERRDETCERLHSVLGDSCISCEIQSLGAEYETFTQAIPAIAPAVAEELFSPELSNQETRKQALTPDLSKLKKATIMVDNCLSPALTLFQIQCVDQKGLLYDIMRMSKDSDIRIAYGRYSSPVRGYRDVDLFIRQNDGQKILDSEKQVALCDRLKLDMLHPLRVVISNRGPDTELVVANPVESSGEGRPRVFYDVTYALKVLGICIFSAEIWRQSTDDRQWEIYRFLLEESPEFPLSRRRVRDQVVDKVRRMLMGWWDSTH